MERKSMSVYGMKGKLISAVCMLLVAVIMVVSSTYAWFTLSTKPEVKGISTAIGANGALEIRLNTTDAEDTNASFGNLVDLSTGYGLDKIVLLPSKLHLDADGKINNQFLMIPQYNEYGKVTGTSGNRTEAGLFNGQNFVAGNGTGVRAVGVASGLTDRQLAYRNAKYSAATNASLATNGAASSLNTNGAVLGNIVIKKATVGDTATYTAAEVASLQSIVNDLQGTADKTGVLQYIENAYEQMIIAYAASAQLDDDDIAGTNVALADAIYSTVKANLANDTLTLEKIATDKAIKVAVDGTTYTFPLETTPAAETGAETGTQTGTQTKVKSPILTSIEALIATKANVAAAQSALTTLTQPAKESYVWSDISGILQYLIVIDKVTVNGKTAAEIKADMDGFANTVMNQGIKIQLNNEAGVYEEIADHCGDYSATVTMKNVEVKGITFETLTANMATKSDKAAAPYLTVAQAAIVAAGEPSGTTTNAQPMTEFYGYIIDLIFRTNAANSDLLLQTEAADRIYEDNTNERTQGGGSSMTFKAVSEKFTTDQVKGLMNSIRIVFFDTDGRNVLGYAKLDMANATVGADGVTAKMYLYETVETYTYTYTPAGESEAVSTTYYVATSTDDNDNNVYTYYSNIDMTTDVTSAVVANFSTAASAIPDGFVKGSVDKALTGDAAVITAMAQNQEVKVSTLVYLDGETLENKDVAATGTNSVIGKMNLQFASSEELSPMEYGDLHITDSNS